MFTFDVNVPNDDLNNAIIQELRLLGIKNGCLPKRQLKVNQNSKDLSGLGAVFRKNLHLLPSRVVPLHTSVQAEVPTFVHEVCSHIVHHADTEGIFRKGGSAARQREIKAQLDAGHKINFADHHVIDAANILKYFLRELPEPLLPFAYHDTFLNCLRLENSIDAILLVCLLLPRQNLYVLAYLMEFFHLISELSQSNKMTCRNLAIVITPSLMPISEKVSMTQNPKRVDAHVSIVEVLIANSERLGVLPEGVLGKLSLATSLSNISTLSDDHGIGTAFSSKKKRRRSGSLTRMFNGFKKIVGSKSSPGMETDQSEVEEDVASHPSNSGLSTPCVKSAQKRKASDATSAFSSKKKKDVLKSLPQGAALANTPFKKTQNASVSELSETSKVCPHPNPQTHQKNKEKSPQKVKNRRFFVPRTYSETDSHSLSSNKKGLSGVSNFVIKKQKHRLRHSASGNFLERSWSAVSSSHWGRKKLRQSDNAQFSSLSNSLAYTLVDCDSSGDADVGIDLSQEDPFDLSPSDFVQVPKREYEDLKSRMSAIETCLSQELSNASTHETISSPGNINAANTVLAVQTVYEKTLEDANVAKDASTDQLAKRLSRELKIRRSSDSKVIRSPSARKIGSLRRRSREKQSPSLRRELRRNKSWHMMQRPANLSTPTLPTVEAPLVPCSRLRRGRPNTVFSGLPHPTPNRIVKDLKTQEISVLGSSESPGSSGSVTRSQTRRASSFHGSEKSSPVCRSSKKCRSQVNLAKAALLAHAQQKSKGYVDLDGQWFDAEELLNSSKDLLNTVPPTGRESIAKLRCENAGKVLATAKLFSGNQELEKQGEVRSKAHDSMAPRVSLRKSHEPQRFSLDSPQERITSHMVLKSSISEAKLKSDTCLSDSVAPYTNVSSQKSALPLCQSVNKCSPAASPLCKKTKKKLSPSQSPNKRNGSSKIKKHSSMKIDRAVHTQPVKRHLSVPVPLIDIGKENHSHKSLPVPQSFERLSPKRKNDSKSVSENVSKISISPLKDCNRITVPTLIQHGAKHPPGAVCMTPNIKQPLTLHTPNRKPFTPQSNRGCSGNTPMRVLANACVTPIQSAQQRSNRVKHYTKASVRP